MEIFQRQQLELKLIEEVNFGGSRLIYKNNESSNQQLWIRRYYFLPFHTPIREIWAKIYSAMYIHSILQLNRFTEAVAILLLSRDSHHFISLPSVYSSIYHVCAQNMCIIVEWNMRNFVPNAKQTTPAKSNDFRFGREYTILFIYMSISVNMSIYTENKPNERMNEYKFLIAWLNTANIVYIYILTREFLCILYCTSIYYIDIMRVCLYFSTVLYYMYMRVKIE